MDVETVARATSSVLALAASLGLAVERAVVLQNSNMLALRLVPCDVFARVALAGQEVAAFEIEVARRLAVTASPVAVLEPRVEQRVYERDGFVTTFWTYYEVVEPAAAPADYADALRRLHAGMRSVDLAAPHFSDRVAEAERLSADRALTPALVEADRDLLRTTLDRARTVIADRAPTEQLLHGEPHPGNVLSTPTGVRFIDLETCCRGPVEFDLAHVPDSVVASYPDVDDALLSECRRLVLAMVAAWRWDSRDQFPDGRRMGQTLLGLLRAGPPWPTLDDVT